MSATDHGAPLEKQGLAWACEQARKGRYARARRLLAETLAAGGCTEAEALDLQARMCAQQGHLLQAESLWLKAQSVDPGNPVYERALARLRGTLVVSGPWRRLTGGLACGALAACMVVAVVMWRSEEDRRHGAIRASLDLRASRADLDRLADRGVSLEKRLEGRWLAEDRRNRDAMAGQARAQESLDAIAAACSTQAREAASIQRVLGAQLEAATADGLRATASAESRLRREIDGHTAALNGLVGRLDRLEELLDQSLRGASVRQADADVRLQTVLDGTGRGFRSLEDDMSALSRRLEGIAQDVASLRDAADAEQQRATMRSRRTWRGGDSRGETTP